MNNVNGAAATEMESILCREPEGTKASEDNRENDVEGAGGRNNNNNQENNMKKIQVHSAYTTKDSTTETPLPVEQHSGRSRRIRCPMRRPYCILHKCSRPEQRSCSKARISRFYRVVTQSSAS